MMKTRIYIASCTAFAAATLSASTVVNFDSYAVGSAPPPPWIVTASSGNIVAVTDAAFTTSNRALGLSQVGSGSAHAKLPAIMSAPAGMKTVIRFDMNPSIVLRPADNFVSGGYVTINRNNGYRAAAFKFDVQDSNDLSGSDLPAPNELKLVFMKPDFTEEVVAYFVPGTWYRFVVTLDYEAWTSTLRVENPGGGLIAERVYPNTYKAVPDYIQFYGAFKDTAYVDSITIENVLPTVPQPIITASAFTEENFTLSWVVEGSTPVIVQRRSSLTTGSWENIHSATGSGSFIDLSPPPERGFYRVVVP
jgi:hypothetical protein